MKGFFVIESISILSDLVVSINGRLGKSKGSLISREVFEQEFYLTTEKAIILQSLTYEVAAREKVEASERG